MTGESGLVVLARRMGLRLGLANTLGDTDARIDDPADPRDLEAWSSSVGASTRTLSRLFRREVGMGFGAWRRQLRLISAIRRLGTGADVTSVAFDLGYGSPSAFIAMFRRALGDTPARYVGLQATGQRDRATRSER